MSGITFSATDGHLLQAILFGCGSSSVGLSGVISMAASLEGEPLCFESFDGGLARLLRARLITMLHERIQPTPMILEDLQELIHATTDVSVFHAVLMEYLHSIGEQIATERSPAVWSTGTITPKMFDRAFQ